MTASLIIRELSAAGITLQVKGDTLRWQAPKGIMTPELLAHIKRRKADLLAELARQTVTLFASPPDPTPTPPSVTKSPAWPGAWFAPGRLAPADSFPTQNDTHLTDGTRGPDWIDYAYELHNRGLIVVNGWIMRDAANFTGIS